MRFVDKYSLNYKTLFMLTHPFTYNIHYTVSMDYSVQYNMKEAILYSKHNQSFCLIFPLCPHIRHTKGVPIAMRIIKAPKSTQGFQNESLGRPNKPSL